MPRELRMITWVDSAGEDRGWMSVDRAKTLVPQTIVTVGFVISEGDRHVVLVPSIDEDRPGEDEMCMGPIAIPKVSIVEDYALV